MLVSVCTGEVHLETCIQDLRDRFARVPLTVSPPLIAFRETIADFTETPDVAPRPPKVQHSLLQTYMSPSMRSSLECRSKLCSKQMQKSHIDECPVKPVVTFV